jgi:hypothetical protein
MTSVDEDVLKTSLATALGAGKVQIIGFLGSRQQSIICHALCDGRELAVKLCINGQTGKPDPDASRRQYSSLVLVHQKMLEALGHYDVPEPIVELPTLAGYAMSWLGGSSLSASLRSCSVEAALVKCRRAGRWLGWFHHAGPLHSGRADLATKAADVHDMLSRPVASVVFAEAVSKLERDLSEIQQISTSMSWVHGDSKPDNVQLVADTTFGIDIDIRTSNSVEHDLAQFLNDMELMLRGARYLHLMSHRALLEQAVLGGYSESGPAYSARLLNWLRLWSAVSRWHARSYGQPARGLRRWLEIRAYTALVKRRLEPLSAEMPVEESIACSEHGQALSPAESTKDDIGVADVELGSHQPLQGSSRRGAL